MNRQRSTNINPMKTPLQRILAERGISQGQLARDLGYDKGYVSKVANGHMIPRADRACRIARRLGVAVEDLFAEAAA